MTPPWVGQPSLSRSPICFQNVQVMPRSHIIIAYKFSTRPPSHRYVLIFRASLPITILISVSKNFGFKGHIKGTHLGNSPVPPQNTRPQVLPPRCGNAQGLSFLHHRCSHIAHPVTPQESLGLDHLVNQPRLKELYCMLGQHLPMSDRVHTDKSSLPHASNCCLHLDIVQTISQTTCYLDHHIKQHP
ncbi:hypothetical protein PMIN03_004610 [Paraphaeosphaeria minitans]